MSALNEWIVDNILIVLNNEKFMREKEKFIARLKEKYEIKNNEINQ